MEAAVGATRAAVVDLAGCSATWWAACSAERFPAPDQRRLASAAFFVPPSDWRLKAVVLTTMSEQQIGQMRA
jgi:hypothetical protein